MTVGQSKNTDSSSCRRRSLNVPLCVMMKNYLDLEDDRLGKKSQIYRYIPVTTSPNAKLQHYLHLTSFNCIQGVFKDVRAGA